MCWCWSVSQDFEVCVGVGQSVRTLRFVLVLVSQSGLWSLCWSVSQDFEVCVDVGQSILTLEFVLVSQDFEVCVGVGQSVKKFEVCVGQSVRTLRCVLVLVSKSGL